MELGLVLRSWSFDITVLALIIIWNIELYKHLFIPDFKLLLALMKLHV